MHSNKNLTYLSGTGEEGQQLCSRRHSGIRLVFCVSVTACIDQQSRHELATGKRFQDSSFIYHVHSKHSHSNTQAQNEMGAPVFLSYVR